MASAARLRARAILVLALGIGASMALFAALDRVLFRPLPYADPDRLVSVGWMTVPPVYEGQTESMIDRFYVQEWETPPAPFQSATTMFGSPGTCQIAEGQPEGLRCGRADHNLLRVLGVRVALGRDFAPEDDVRGAPPVALISHALWVRRFGADPGVVDRTLSLEGGPSVLQVPVIGVLPPDFEMPFDAADILVPAQMRPLDPNDPFTRPYSHSRWPLSPRSSGPRIVPPMSIPSPRRERIDPGAHTSHPFGSRCLPESVEL